MTPILENLPWSRELSIISLCIVCFIWLHLWKPWVHRRWCVHPHQGLYSLRNKMSYRAVLKNLLATRCTELKICPIVLKFHRQKKSERSAHLTPNQGRICEYLDIVSSWTRQWTSAVISINAYHENCIFLNHFYDDSGIFKILRDNLCNTMFVDACVARYQQLLYDIRPARQTDKRGPCLPRGRISTTGVIPSPDIIQCKCIFSVPVINSTLRWCFLVFPGIAMYPGGAKFLACGHYYNNVVTSKGMCPWLIIHPRRSAYSLSQKIMSCPSAI